MTREERIEMINKYEESVKALEQMKELYEKVYLFGGYYDNMMNEIDSQIADCKLYINNLTERLNRD